MGCYYNNGQVKGAKKGVKGDNWQSITPLTPLHRVLELAKKAIFVLTFSEGISIGGRVFRGVTSQKHHTECCVKKQLRVSGFILFF